MRNFTLFFLRLDIYCLIKFVLGRLLAAHSLNIGKGVLKTKTLCGREITTCEIAFVKPVSLCTIFRIHDSETTG
ncbi:hypothetical protein C5Y93_26465 [Blastopirellula marina]|uniref:Uncharacterized protein n=1 Tax=Blastopirellula marina TaxID=124 RepID=A0A2S8GFL3_9BACT|nr:hypothetical protein C5Y93_26465 [Blastopirellula marina]